jgi:hypothetical protein
MTSAPPPAPSPPHCPTGAGGGLLTPSFNVHICLSALIPPSLIFRILIRRLFFLQRKYTITHYRNFAFAFRIWKLFLLERKWCRANLSYIFYIVYWCSMYGWCPGRHFLILAPIKFLSATEAARPTGTKFKFILKRKSVDQFPSKVQQYSTLLHKIFQR